MKWIEINALIAKEDEDDVSGIFYSIGANSLEIEDPNDLVELSNSKDQWDFFGIDLEGLDLEKIKVKAYFSKEEDTDSILKLLKEKIEDRGLGIINTVELEDEDYLNNWKKYFKPFKIGENIIIKPSWEDYIEKDGDIIIDIDPGMAFGTGTHETTSLCIEALEKYIEKGDRVFDIGCGSGILSIASAKLGSGKITSIDLDPLCVKISKENIKNNNLENIIDVKKGNLLDVIEDKADLIVANIIAEAIITMSENIGDYIKKDGIFIASGIILRKKDSVIEALEKNNFKIIETKTQGEWISIISTKI